MTTFGPGVLLTRDVVATTPCATEPPIVGFLAVNGQAEAG